MSIRERITEYNKVNRGYNITGIKKLPKSHLDWSRVNGAKSLDELYKSYSDIKRSSFNEILETYKPEIISLQGNAMAYSVYLVASNGDTLWITRDNNYLVDVQKEVVQYEI